MASDGPKWGQEDFFPTNPDLADILGRTDLNFDNLYFFDFLDPKFLDFQVPRSPNFWISRSPDLQIPRFPGCQISRCRRRAAPPDEFSDPNLTLLPTHPGIKYVARDPAATMTLVPGFESHNFLGTKNVLPASSYRDRGTRLLEPRTCYQNLVPRSWY